MNLTARFKYESCFIVETATTDFSGTHTKRKIVFPQIEVDFPIDNYVECDYHYDIIIKEKDPNICDGGESISIINIPKDYITITNKHLKEK